MTWLIASSAFAIGVFAGRAYSRREIRLVKAEALELLTARYSIDLTPDEIGGA